MKLFLLFLLAFIGASTHALQATPSKTTASTHKTDPSTSSHKIEPSSSHKAVPTTSSHKVDPVTTSHKVSPVTTSHKVGPVTTSHKVSPVTTSHKASTSTIHSSSVTPSKSTSVKPMNSTSVTPSKSTSVKPMNSTSVTPSKSTSVKPMNSTSVTPSKSTSVKPMNSTSVTPSKSTSVKPMNSTSVTPSKSTSVKPMNSTSIHSSSVTPSKSTSGKPMTTTMVPTLPPKTTTPSPDQTFTVKDKDNNTCLQLRGDIKIMITYSDVNKTIVEKTIYMDRNTKTSGKCSDLTAANSSSSIMLSLGTDVQLDVMFHGGEKWYLSQIKATIDNKDQKVLKTKLTHLVASNKYDTKSNGGFYQAKANHSYGCVTEKKLPLHNSNTTKAYNITVDFKDITMQPFLSKEDPRPFINGVTCPATSGGDTGSSIVPIAVGCALAGLIVIVLIAYLIGRRKGNNRGYQQV